MTSYDPDAPGSAASTPPSAPPPSPPPGYAPPGYGAGPGYGTAPGYGPGPGGAPPFGAAPEPAKKRGCLTKLGIAAAVLVVLMVIGAIAGGGGDDDEAGTDVANDRSPATTAAPAEDAAAAPATTAAPTSAAPATTAAPAEEESGEDVHAIGDRAQTSDLGVTVHGVQDPYQSSNQFDAPQAGNRFVAVEAELFNDDDEPITYSSLMGAELTDSLSRPWTPALAGFDLPQLDGDVPAGGSRRGWVIFEVPQDATGLRVRISGELTAQGALFDLGG